MSKKHYDYSEYVGVGHNSTDNELSEISKLAEDQQAAQKRVDELEKQLNEAKEALKKISERLLPAKMEELGLQDYTTTSGIHIAVEEKIRAALSVENRPKGFKWLEDNGYGGMIKTKVVVAYKRGELEKAQEFTKELLKKGSLANLERKVEPMTLTAFVSEQLKAGKELPLDVFGVFRQRVATIKK